MTQARRVRIEYTGLVIKHMTLASLFLLLGAPLWAGANSSTAIRQAGIMANGEASSLNLGYDGGGHHLPAALMTSTTRAQKGLRAAAKEELRSASIAQVPAPSLTVFHSRQADPFPRSAGDGDRHNALARGLIGALSGGLLGGMAGFSLSKFI